MFQHKHKCDKCGTVFEHSNECGMYDHVLFVLSHSCPACGVPLAGSLAGGPVDQYLGEEAPAHSAVCGRSGGLQGKWNMGA